jgi:putative phosphoribosyl transferase
MNRDQHFIDRHDAGRRLAVLIERHLSPREDVVVLALPRGGVPVGYEVARLLGVPLDVLFVRKLGAPGFPELGIGAVVDGDRPQRILNEPVIAAVQPPPGYIEAEERRQLDVIEQRKLAWRRGRPPASTEGRTVVLVDDGIATGGTVRAALKALASSGAHRTMLGVPVAPRDMQHNLPIAPGDFVCLAQPDDFVAVGMYYRDFSQTSDAEVVDLLSRAAVGFEPPIGPLRAVPGASA